MSVATTYSDIGQRTTVWAEGKMLEHALPILVLELFADVKPLPKNKADTISFRRPIPYAVSTTQLSEGVTPPPKQMRYEDVVVQMGQYGDLVEISDRVADMSEDPVLANASMLSGEQAAETRELIMWGILRAGTNVSYSSTTASPTSRAQVNERITLQLQRAVIRSLKQQRATPITSMVAASPKFGTEAVSPGFVAFGHTDLEQDIRDMDGFVPVERYGNSSSLSMYECGKVEGVRYILSPVLDPFFGAGSATANGMNTTGSNVDVYPLIFVSKNSYGAVPLKGAGSMNPTVINPGKIDKSDPLGQRGLVGWKMYFAATILNEAWLSRVEVGVTDLSV